ncbi:MAG: peptide deformylase [Dongiaceae bacterium]
MDIYPLVIAPDPALRRKADPLTNITGETLAILERMLATMYFKNRGIGLAAPQVNINQRLVVMDTTYREKDKQPLLLINPEIIWQSDEPNIYEEGCLSLPGFYAEITRPKKVGVRYLDQSGKPQEFEADDLLATCVQHEIDHLNGVLFVDYLSKLKRDMILKRLIKQKKEGVFDRADGGQEEHTL